MEGALGCGGISADDCASKLKCIALTTLRMALARLILSSSVCLCSSFHTFIYASYFQASSTVARTALWAPLIPMMSLLSPHHQVLYQISWIRTRSVLCLSSRLSCASYLLRLPSLSAWPQACAGQIGGYGSKIVRLSGHRIRFHDAVNVYTDMTSRLRCFMGR